MADYEGGTKDIAQIRPAEVGSFAKTDKEIQFVDVRQPGEFGSGHAAGSFNLPLNSLARDIDKLNPEAPTFLICQTGYRSSLATSFLENAGFESVYNVEGGTSAWIKNALEIETSNASCAAS
jgi:rhodanese-related sulfurtransferase